MVDFDVVFYAGSVSVHGYLELSKRLDESRTPGVERVLFIPVTNGGDPNAGYRIARALGHYYPKGVMMGIPSVCKSAGTLMCIGANELIVADRGELGPLDIQLSSKEELFEMSSGLDIMQALDALQETMNSAFKTYLYDLKFNGRLGTKIASDIASKMAVGLVSPIAQQIDPLKLGEHQRALNIATAYGARLNDKFKNTTMDKINKLLTAYPAHGFVIDRKEIAELFTRVRPPSEIENKIFSMFSEIYQSPSSAGGSPVVWICNKERIESIFESATNNSTGVVPNDDTGLGAQNVVDREAAGGDSAESGGDPEGATGEFGGGESDVPDAAGKS